MAARIGSPAFMLHDPRKLLATVGERLGVGNAVLRRTLNHTPPRGDVLHRHYVQLGVEDVRIALERIQSELSQLWGDVTKEEAAGQLLRQKTHQRLRDVERKSVKI